MNDAGRIGFVIKGNYDAAATYDFLDVVYYGNSSYVAKKLTTGNTPVENNDYWQILATSQDINEQATVFEEAQTRSNINSGETIPTLFGKIKKWFSDAVTGVKGDAETEYRTGNVNLTPDNIGAISASKLLTTIEQIEANTDVSNVAGAAAIKSLKSDFANSINQINSNLDKQFATLYTDYVEGETLPELAERLVINKLLPTSIFCLRIYAGGRVFASGQIYEDYQFGEFIIASHLYDDRIYLCQIDYGNIRISKIQTEIIAQSVSSS